jgi:uncharacterized iron-regulated protein
MNKIMLYATFLVFILSACRPIPGEEGLRLYELESGRTLAGREAVETLKSARLILIGEHHGNKFHHQAQLAIIQALHDAGRPAAVGLEMFRQESQADLDRWVSGELKEQEFKPIYLDNWNLEWRSYRPIFRYARDQQIPMVGLNIPRRVTSQVAYHGFDSLTEEQKAGLNDITCDVTDRYRRFIRDAYGAHAHGAMDFDNFCQAQLLWDAAMANHALSYLDTYPDKTMVLLAGSGHARKPAIPFQVREKDAALPMLVLLPRTEGVFEPGTVTTEDADYLIISY